MKSLVVDVAPDHLESLIRRVSPARALSELIWNSLDADASNVIVSFERNALDTISAIIIEDDGHGISYEEVERAFGSLGGSRKLKQRRSPAGRPYHGRRGQGRYRSFAMGQSVRWESTFRDDDGLFKYFQIDGDRNALKRFSISDEPRVCADGNHSGVKVVVQGIENEAVVNLDVAKLAEKLCVMLAPYLLAHPAASVRVDGKSLDPRATLRTVHTLDLEIDDETVVPAHVKCQVYEWTTGDHRNRFLCTEAGLPVGEEPSSGMRPSPFSHTVYVFSDYIGAIAETSEADVGEVDPTYRAIIQGVNQALTMFAREKLAEQVREAVEKLKQDEIYPYKGQPATPLEKAEREVFDICAVRVHQLLPGFQESPRESKTLMMGLLREAIEQNPNSMKRVLKQVLRLSQQDLDEFAGILDRTSLSAVISTAKLIGDRLTFLNGLEQILFASDIAPIVKERAHLHQILLHELWIFGEEYQYGVDDVSLKNVLRHHLHILGRQELAASLTPEDLRGLEDIPDVCLWRQYIQGRQDEYEHLVIELKRPTCPIGKEQLNQIAEYAQTVADNPRFDRAKTRWTFVLLGTKLDAFAKFQCNQEHRPPGLYVQARGLDVYVYEWRQIIQAAKGRMQFLKDRLNYAVDNEKGLEYLRRYYENLLPKALR